MRKRYTIQITSHHSASVLASDLTQAKYKIWNSIKDGYTYGFKTRSAFVKGTKEKNKWLLHIPNENGKHLHQRKKI